MEDLSNNMLEWWISNNCFFHLINQVCSVLQFVWLTLVGTSNQQ